MDRMTRWSQRAARVIAPLCGTQNERGENSDKCCTPLAVKVLLRLIIFRTVQRTKQKKLCWLWVPHRDHGIQAVHSWGHVSPSLVLGTTCVGGGVRLSPVGIAQKGSLGTGMKDRPLQN